METPEHTQDQDEITEQKTGQDDEPDFEHDPSRSPNAPEEVEELRGG